MPDAAKEKWVARRNRELLPVPHFHSVFTIPHHLNSLTVKHFRLITDILFASTSRSLIEFGANPLWHGGSLAFSLVLHTWTQTLKRHLHVHALVAGGAFTHEKSGLAPSRASCFRLLRCRRYSPKIHRSYGGGAHCGKTWAN
jgi:hypothetical protein